MIYANNKIMKEKADGTLKRVYRRKENSERKREQPWINEKIRERIRQRRNMNKRRRKATAADRIEKWYRLYMKLKKEVQVLIKEEIYK